MPDRNDGFTASADIPQQSDLKRGYTEIKNALNKYPESFLSDKNVKNIHLVGNLLRFGTNYTGRARYFVLANILN